MIINSNQYIAIGKRKTAIAKLFLQKGTGIILINNKTFTHYFAGLKTDINIMVMPLLLCQLQNQYDIQVKLSGGGLKAQLDAIKLALSRCICQIDKNYKTILNKFSLLNRDSRIKERRKYGLKKARKASQYSKR